MSYPFKPGSYRAQCLNVVDGDTADFCVDLGFHQYMKARFRFARINAPEMNSPDTDVRAKAQAAKEFVKQAIGNVAPCFTNAAWSVRIVPEKDPDNYGRWLAEVFYVSDSVGRHDEISLNQELLDLGLAALYKK